MNALVINSHEDAIAAVPHVLGFQPKESLVLVPFSQDLPWVRVEIPTTAADRMQLWSESLRDALSSHALRAGKSGRMAVLCFTADRENAEVTSRDLGRQLAEIGIGAPVRLWTNDAVWTEFNTAVSGRCSQSAADRMAAASVYSGRVQPAVSRESMAASMVGDREPVAARLQDAWTARSTPPAEREWALNCVGEFLADGAQLSDADAARLLVAVQTTSTRNALWGKMDRDGARAHQALWVDMTRRAPDQVRAPAASLAAFSSWLAGDGAKAWCALDEVPEDKPYPMAAIVAGALEAALPPSEWENHQLALAALTSELDETFVPDPMRTSERHAATPGGPSPGPPPPRR